MAASGALGEREGGGGLGVGQPGKEAQANEGGGFRVLLGQFFERLVDEEHDLIVGPEGDVHVIEVDVESAGTAFEGFLLAGPLDEDAPHGLGCGSEEMGSALKARLLLAEEAQPDLVDECGGLEGMPGRLTRHLIRSETAQLTIDQKEQVIGGFGVAGLDGCKHSGNITHPSSIIACPDADVECGKACGRHGATAAERSRAQGGLVVARGFRRSE
jgi:hypothetical protein